VRIAVHNILISKSLTSLLIGVFGFAVFLPITGSVHPLGLTKELALAGSISAFLASVLFLVVFMGLQVSTSVVSSRVADVLIALPISRSDISKILLICLVRIFDIPFVAAIVVLLSGHFFAGGSLLGGFVSFWAIIATEAFALALTTGLARFFYSRVARSGGRSKWNTFMRLVSMSVWILPTLGVYLIVSFAGNIINAFGVFAHALSSYIQLLAMVYPFSFGLLISYTSSSQTVDCSALSISIIASMAYLAFAGHSFRWVVHAVTGMESQGISSIAKETVRDTLIKPQVPWLGIMRKDLRIASRLPSYASLFLLPAIQTTALAISFSSSSDLGFGVALGFLTGVSVMTLLLPPTIFSIEGLASTYTRSLPLTKKTLILAKTALTLLTYAISLFILFLTAASLGRDFTLVLTYGLIHAFSIAAASMLELAILTNKFWREGSALGNIYTRPIAFISILAPALAITALPVVITFIAYLSSKVAALPVFLATAIIEFAVMASVIFGKKKAR
jgi:hypothetical protein